MKKLLWSALICLSVFTTAAIKAVQAQSKVTAPAGIWPELQVSYGVGEKGLFFFQNQYRINADSRFNDLRESGLLSNFERIQFSLGYEHTFSDHWRGGAIWRYAAEDVPSTSFYGLFLRHSGALKSLYFNKQLLLEYVDQERQVAAARYKFMAELGKRLPIKQRYLTPSISYEAALFSEFGAENSVYDDRFIDRLQLRLNLTYEVKTRLRITPYIMRQTACYYMEVSPVYDDNDNLIKNGYRAKRNIITPMWGIELKYDINRQASTANFSY